MRELPQLEDVASDIEAHGLSKRFGAIDVLFSNAGNFGVVAPIESYPEDVFDAVHAVHVKGAFLACKYAVPHMNDGGSIVITSSVAGTRGDPGVYAYITAKHAQIGLMRCLAKELAPLCREGIRIAVETLQRLRQVPGVHGVHLMGDLIAIDSVITTSTATLDPSNSEKGATNDSHTTLGGVSVADYSPDAARAAWLPDLPSSACNWHLRLSSSNCCARPACALALHTSPAAADNPSRSS